MNFFSTTHKIRALNVVRCSWLLEHMVFQNGQHRFDKAFGTDSAKIRDVLHVQSWSGEQKRFQWTDDDCFIKPIH